MNNRMVPQEKMISNFKLPSVINLCVIYTQQLIWEKKAKKAETDKYSNTVNFISSMHEKKKATQRNTNFGTIRSNKECIFDII